MPVDACPFDELMTVDHRLERRLVGKKVLATMLFPRSRLPRRVRDGVPQPGNVRRELFAQCGLSGAGRRGDDEQDAAALGR